MMSDDIQRKDEQVAKISATTVESSRAKQALYTASQSQLIWRRFKRHKLAQAAMILLALLYVVAAFGEFIAPYDTKHDFKGFVYAPPAKIHLFDESGFRGPFVYGLKGGRDEQYNRVFEEVKDEKYPVRFFVSGDPYKMWGLFETDRHLFGVGEEGQIFLFGTDRLGRDLFSRVIYGTRISLTIGLVGVFLSFVLGLVIGGISGYFGGIVDEVIQRLIDLLVAIPQLPLWMALAAAVPRDWDSIQTYFAITVVLSIVGWAGLARTVRGRLLSLREEDFAIAARVSGVSEWRIITKHLLPLFASYIVVAITLAVPGMIIGETSLSFIGLGIQPPAVSWGTLLQDAQMIANVALHPWMLIPALFVIVTVLMFNFLGDGLRDAADPYSMI
uniref:Binding-protein-dependent transport systems inner membrane component n=1 Tax=uncultured marine bacterium 1n22 TaxID=662659 RepID=D2DIQ7_9BACT|nr:binding-protein-dependent transport systems inner membrane component [uncultured marine bacterium 1n22]